MLSCLIAAASSFLRFFFFLRLQSKLFNVIEHAGGAPRELDQLSPIMLLSIV